MITPDDFNNIMLKIEKEYGHGEDEEEFHLEADELINQVMRELGYGDGMDIFVRNPKWYC